MVDTKNSFKGCAHAYARWNRDGQNWSCDLCEKGLTKEEELKAITLTTNQYKDN